MENIENNGENKNGLLEEQFKVNLEKSIVAMRKVATKKNGDSLKFEQEMDIIEFPFDLPKDVIEEEPIKFESEEDYMVFSNTDDISFVEFAIINNFFFNAYKGKFPEIEIEAYGGVDGIGRISFGGVFDVTEPFWFNFKLKDNPNSFYLQTRLFLNNNRELVTQLHLTAKKGLPSEKMETLFTDLKKLAFNNCEYKGKCIQVKLREGRFRGIKIIDVEKAGNELILNETQRKFIDHFISRIGRGSTARYLFNGPPGCGKTESIREISRKLIPQATFIIPDFSSSEDLTSIMEACEIFDNGVIIMDDIDLYLGSRDNGTYTRLLGEFLSFFDGVKKRKISLLASTNDKSLVDKAAERPGRFNLTLDFGYLDANQIVQVCQIHLPEVCQIQEVYDVLIGQIAGKKTKVTGAFIANLGDNIREMSEDGDFSIGDVISLIKESYKGFYSINNINNDNNSMGFSR